MTPEISIRTFTDDQYVLDKVFYANNYRLKQFPEKEKVVTLDIGAHTGCFSLLCLMRGADTAYCVEPFWDNFRMLCQNLEHFQDKARTLKLGVYTENRFASLEYPQNKNNFFHLSEISLRGVESDTPTDTCYLVKLDDLLDSIPAPEIDLLKIHIGYAEAEILLSSERIDKCNFICGETTTSEEKITELVDYMKTKGFGDSFLAESKEKENTQLFLFAKEKCEDMFNLYVSGTPEGAEEEERMATQMTPLATE